MIRVPADLGDALLPDLLRRELPTKVRSQRLLAWQVERPGAVIRKMLLSGRCSVQAWWVVHRNMQGSWLCPLVAFGCVSGLRLRATDPPGHSGRGLIMKSAPQIAMAVAVGYVLGRSRKMKLAITAAGVMAGRRFADPKELLAKGGKLVDASPELQKLTGEARARLLDAAKAAAMAAATNKIESIGDNLTKRAAELRDPNVGAAEEQVSNAGKKAASLGTKAARRSARTAGVSDVSDDEERESEGTAEKASERGTGHGERAASSRSGARRAEPSGRRSSTATQKKESAAKSRSGERGKTTGASGPSGGSSARTGSRDGGSAGQGQRKKSSSKSSATKKTP